jgi:hypothetical protein
MTDFEFTSDHLEDPYQAHTIEHAGVSDRIDVETMPHRYGPEVHEQDLNNDGRVDVVSADTDGDGTDDAWQYDLNNDGIMDMTGYDTDHDGSIDQKEYDRNADGRIEEVRVDADHDGHPELRQTDTNNDGRLDTMDRDSNDDGQYDQHDRIDAAKTMPHWGPNADYGSV